jgi:hypothetical protein
MEAMTPLKVAVVNSAKTQRYWARRAGMSDKKFSNLATGWARPTEWERRTLARLLSVPVEELFPTAPQPPGPQPSKAR